LKEMTEALFTSRADRRTHATKWAVSDNPTRFAEYCRRRIDLRQF
jgi:hypothetical protein